MLITSIKPDITREQAVTKFRGGFSEWRHGRLRVVSDFYIPYRLFRITWQDGRRNTDTFLALDAVAGRLDLIEFNHSPTEDHLMRVDGPMIVEGGISDQEAQNLMRERMMRSVFMKGFFRLNRVNVDLELAERLHIPYWVGVYERRGQAHLEVINALHGRFEGARLREIVAEWFHP